MADPKLITTLSLDGFIDSFPEAVGYMAQDLTHEVTETDDETFVRAHCVENNTKFAILAGTGWGMLILVRWDNDDVDTAQFYDEDDGWESLPDHAKTALR